MEFRPEGCIYDSAENQNYISSPEGLSEAMEKGIILEARAVRCTSRHDLIVELPCAKGIIPRNEGALGIDDGKTKDIAVISRVNKIVCFTVSSISLSDEGEVIVSLSRKNAQLRCMNDYISVLKSGDIISAMVTHLEKFGSFVDIGCGIPSLIPIDSMSVSRISHPSDRFYVGQLIKAIVKTNENERIYLTHKELLGTWTENASCFSEGETVPGIVRSIEDYGIFVELTPNLAGLAEPRSGIHSGQSVSVYIKAIIPEKMKVKLVIVDVCGNEFSLLHENKYFINDTHISEWIYSPPGSGKDISTLFI